MRRIGERVALRLPRFIEERFGRAAGADGAGSAPPAHPDSNPFLAARALNLLCVPAPDEGPWTAWKVHGVT